MCSSAIVAAIEIGSTYTRCAFSISYVLKNDHNKIYSPVDSSVLPTCILFDETKDFHSFGKEAEGKYAILTESNEHKSWYFFRHFKKCLYNRMAAVVRDFSIKDVTGKQMPAVDVHSAAIRYIKNRCEKAITHNMMLNGCFMEDDICWVITVPTIANEPVKQLMRDAAIKAGISDRKLVIVLETEAASAFCKLTTKTGNSSPCNLPEMCLGPEYIVLDVGGGTVDMTYHEKGLKEGSFTNLHKTEGCNIGGLSVDEAFVSLLSDIYGLDVMESFKETCNDGMLEFLSHFNGKKMIVPSLFRIRIPAFLHELYRSMNGKDIQDEISKSKFAKQIRFIGRGGIMEIDQSLISMFYNAITETLVQHLQQIVEKSFVSSEMLKVFMVGGMSGSKILKERLVECIPDLNLVTTDNPSIAVIKGAVICGYNKTNDTVMDDKLTSVQSPQIMAAAIDFGTSYSGYAFSFKSKPTDISVATWNTSRALQSLKAPTCILFDQSKQFHSFGFEAQDKYAELAFEDEYEGWYFFHEFKMGLYGKMTLNKDTLIADITGRNHLPAMDVFSAAIRYMKNHLMEQCHKQVTGINEMSDIMWVITLPAIWTDVAKQFMHEAAERAGLPSNRIMVALEPEAASIYCKTLTLHADGQTESTLQPGSKVLVLDAGGGTVDITVHEILEDCRLCELHIPTGSDWGGTYVDHAFLEFLSEILGFNVKECLSESDMGGLLDLLRDFEVKKRTIRNDTTNKIQMRVPSVLNDQFVKRNGKTIKESLATQFKDKVKWNGDKLSIDVSVAKTFFSEISDKIVDHLKELLKQENVRDVSTILMVGGFSESALLQTVVRQAFPKKHFLIPKDAGTAVLKGAVLYGHDATIIAERRCRFTYGFAVTKLLSSIEPKYQRHIPKQKIVTGKDGVKRVKDAFDIHVTVGQRVKIGDKQAEKHYHSPNGKDISLQLFLSRDTDPLLVTDHNSIFVGEITIECNGKDDTDVNVRLAFGETELVVEATKEGTAEILKTKFVLLE